MSTYVDAESRRDPRKHRPFPAYGPLDAVLGYVVFYVFVTRATPTVVAVFTDVLGVSPGAVRLWLAIALWFILAVTALDQVRRQLAALGVGSDADVDAAGRERLVPSRAQVAVYLAVVVVGGVVAAVTFERAVTVGISFVRVVATVDVSAFVPVDFVAMVVFFVAFGAATHSLDRLVVGGIRALLYD